MIAPNFSLAELTATSHKDLQEANRIVPPEYMSSGFVLANAILQPIRDKFGPVTVTSGYRGPPLNARVSGSKNSQHMKFEAADIVRPELYEIWAWCKSSNLRYGQCILEYSDGEPTWIHISLGFPWRTEAKSQQHFKLGE